MKPKDLHSPFSWENRQIVIQDRVWYIPNHYYQYDRFSFPGWTHPDTFLTSQPIKVEYCSGNGGWIIAKALEDPNTNWVAVEMLFSRARKIWSKIKNLRLENLLVICAEGQTVTQRYLPSDTITEAFINFPDPWPKRKHAKNRMIQSAFIKEIQRVLTQDGRLTFVTDDQDYSLSTIKEMKKQTGFQSCYDDPYFITELPGYGTSYFEDLWRNQGKSIHYHQFQKIEEI